jgi:hypothetical protein
MLAEGLALARVFDGLVDQLSSAAQAAGRAPQALFLELQHLEHEARASWPMRLRCGTRTLSKNSCAVSLECMPIFSIFWRVMPGHHRHHDERLVRVHRPSLVLASRQHQSACRPLVIHILEPLMT